MSTAFDFNFKNQHERKDGHYCVDYATRGIQEYCYNS